MYVKFDGTRFECFNAKPETTDSLQIFFVEIDGLGEACRNLNEQHNFYENELLQFLD